MTTSQSNLPVVPVDDKSLEDHAQSLPAKVFKPGALTILVALGCGGIIALSGYALAQTTVTGKVDAGVGPVKAELENTNKRIDEMKTDVAAVKRQLDAAEERNARRFEVLYNTILERRPQPGADELTKPQTDGGR